MILNLDKFIETEEPYWRELEGFLERVSGESGAQLSLEEAKRFHYLYQRASADLARLNTFAAEDDVKTFLERLVAEAYSDIHETRRRPRRLTPLTWLLTTLPRTFRAHVMAFWLATGIMFGGAVFGAVLMAVDSDARYEIFPQQFAHLYQSPSERVKAEESGGGAQDGMATFSAQLMKNNISVSIRALAFGMTYGIGTVIMVFYNGVILGAVAQDYVAAGETEFLLGWLLPHGVIEIPAILVGAQAGLVLARAMIGYGQSIPMSDRMRKVAPAVGTLTVAVAIMLVWAGLVEAFISQLHEPVLPYWSKILFGIVELVVLVVFLAVVGRGASATTEAQI